MNLSELQAFLEESGWDEEPFPAHPTDEVKSGGEARQSRRADDYEIESIELSSQEPLLSRPAPTLTDRVEETEALIVPEAVVESTPEQAFEEDLNAHPVVTPAQAEAPVVAPEAVKPKKEKPVKLVPKLTNVVHRPEPELRGSDSVGERLKEIEMAQKMGYLLCKCTWPPQIMVLTGTDHVYRCRRCSRVREM
ncbi:MAG: hypothetical protein ACSHXZ_10905 [Gammaproteobacteria bacterium]